MRPSYGSSAWRAPMLLTLAIIAAPSCAVAAQYEGRFERTLSVSGPVDLAIDSGSGSITVQTGSADSVRIVGTIRASSWRSSGSDDLEARVRRIESEPPIVQQGNRVSVGQQKDSSLYKNISISYELVVPEATALTAHTGSGRVRVGALRGPVKATSGSGSLDIGATAGPVDISTGSGQITVNGAKERIDAHSGSGSISLRNIAGAATAHSGSGSIEVEQTAAGSVRVTNGSGSIRIAGVRSGLVARNGSGSIRVEGTPGDAWDVDSGSGSIHMYLPSEAAFTLNANTGSGSISVDHPVTVQGTIDRRRVQGTVRGGGPTISARTSSGSIDINAGSTGR